MPRRQANATTTTATTVEAETPAPARADAAPTTAACPECGVVHPTRTPHACDPAALWKRQVARWNELSGHAQRARLAECRERGHDERSVPLPATVMCWRCCTYRVVKEKR